MKKSKKLNRIKEEITKEIGSKTYISATCYHLFRSLWMLAIRLPVLNVGYCLFLFLPLCILVV